MIAMVLRGFGGAELWNVIVPLAFFVLGIIGVRALRQIRDAIREKQR